MTRKKELIDDILEHLDASTERLDGDTVDRIARIRAEALREGTDTRPRRSLVWPAAGLATAAAVLLAVFLTRQPEVPVLAAQDLEDIEFLASEEDQDLLENLEFYAWLAENEDALGDG